ncbi:hypothetical protein SH601_10920 [Gracilibacillus sp. S3-1-1]|uniref:Uncharacterized protein n=2 Tax=Gracilibacillus pellucidus TaxID=3095368 RepID=A0ACC6M6A1_9BACI|nr:hypothetical protein [Gracilibacillus sp. S3-1-1]MDX8046494.1 hypothetical protein [Gracilibacillus sp. S3-1-1]
MIGIILLFIALTCKIIPEKVTLGLESDLELPHKQ